MPVCVMPILYCLFWAEWEAKKSGKLSFAASSVAYQLGLSGKQQEQSLWERIRQGASTIDAFGLLLLGFAFALLLSPPSLYATANGGWTNPSMIAMMTVGGVLFFVFVAWEYYFAANPIMPVRILNRTFVLCVCIDFMYYLVGYLTDVYWSSWVYVVQDYTVRNVLSFPPRRRC